LNCELKKKSSEFTVQGSQFTVHSSGFGARNYVAEGFSLPGLGLVNKHQKEESTKLHITNYKQGPNLKFQITNNNQISMTKNRKFRSLPSLPSAIDFAWEHI